jgi:hypothetical protein
MIERSLKFPPILAFPHNGGKEIKGKRHIVKSAVKGKSAFMEAHCHIFQKAKQLQLLQLF